MHVCGPFNLLGGASREFPDTPEVAPAILAEEQNPWTNQIHECVISQTRAHCGNARGSSTFPNGDRNSEGITVKNLYVGNLSFSTTENDLREMFAPYGKVERASLVNDRDTGRSRGFGFVEMTNDTEAAAAISALNGKDSDGRSLTVNEARPKAERTGGGFRGGRGGGGGRDDYRGHARQPREPRW